MSCNSFTRNKTDCQQVYNSVLGVIKQTHTLLTVALKLKPSKLAAMDNSEVDLDGYAESNRRHIVDTALARVRARGIEPRSGLLLLYEQYVRGEIDREELHTRVQNRLTDLITYLPHPDKGREYSELPSSHE